MSKHTPGPWGHKTWDVNKDGEFNYTVEKDDKSICEIIGTGEQAEANARLIAAAPELLTMVGRLGFVLSEVADNLNLDLDGTCIQIKSTQGTGAQMSLSELLEQATTLVKKIQGETNE